MDLVLDFADPLVFDSLYSKFPAVMQPYFSERDHIARQSTSLFLIAYVGIWILYLGSGTLSYIFLFDKELKKNKKYLPNQISKEIYMALSGFHITALVTVPWWIFELRGYSKLYYNIDEYGWPYFVFSMVLFVLFSDCLIYWIHRGIHHPSVYWWLHKPHHLWKVPTPFASHAFHPLDGYAQSIPYHLFVYLFPFNSYAYLTMFVLVNFWTVSIHDAAYFTNHPWINGAAHHTVHHADFVYNYGQYFTLWDRIGGTYRKPVKEFESEMFFEKAKRSAALSKKLAEIDSEEREPASRGGHSKKAKRRTETREF